MYWSDSVSSNEFFKEMFCEFHQNPEGSFGEEETTRRILSYLTEWDIPILDTGLKTGLVGQVQGNKDGPTICLRADIDALPIQEDTDLPFRSENGFMHACGHDFHTTTLLSVAHSLKQQEESLPGTIKLLFQPAEESSHGAEDVIASGVLSDVDAIFGLHVAPSQKAGTLGFRTGAVNASVDRFEIEVDGVGCHAAHPNQGIDPIVISSAIVSALQSIISRNLDPFNPAVVSVTRITGGNTWNVIPMTAELEGTVRTLNENTRALIPKRMEILSKNIAEGFGASVDFRWFPGPPPTNNSPFWVEKAEELAEELNIPFQLTEPSLGGEDFAFYQETIEGLFFQVGVESPYPLHHPKFKANLDALEVASTYFSSLAVQALKIEAERKQE